jgi:hypothetical protein
VPSIDKDPSQNLVGFRPRFRDRRVAVASVATAERRSRAALGLVRSCTVHSGAARITSIVSHDANADVSPPTLAPARPPFTLTATLLGALRGSLFEAKVLLIDFCNCITPYGHQPELSFPRRDDGLDHLPFLTRHARPLLRER